MDSTSPRTDTKKLLARGIDPSTHRKTSQSAALASAANTFRAVAAELIAKQEREGRALITIDKKRWLFSLANAAIGDRPISEIKAPELLALLRDVEVRGHYETAKRMRGSCGMVFRYAIATGRADRDPSADLRGALTAHQVVTEPP